LTGINLELNELVDVDVDGDVGDVVDVDDIGDSVVGDSDDNGNDAFTFTVSCDDNV
jgi:hypothetical protein